MPANWMYSWYLPNLTPIPCVNTIEKRGSSARTYSNRTHLYFVSENNFFSLLKSLNQSIIGSCYNSWWKSRHHLGMLQSKEGSCVIDFLSISFCSYEIYTRSDSAVNYICILYVYVYPKVKIMIREISCMGERMFTEAEISILE